MTLKDKPTYPVVAPVRVILGLTEFLKDIPRQALAAIKGWVNHGVSENDEDLRGPVGYNTPRLQLTEEWSSDLESDGLDPVVREFEEKERERIGPYSPHLAWDERVGTVSEFTAPRRTSYDSVHYRTALDRVRQLLPARSVTSLSLDDSIDRAPKSTNSGLPWFTRERRVVSDYRKRASLVLEGETVEIYPAMAGLRTTPRGNDKWPQQRLIQMTDKIDTYVCGTWLPGILDGLRRHSRFSAYTNLDAVDLSMQRLFRAANGNNLFSSDFDSFDASAAGDILADLLLVIRSWLVNPTGFDLMAESFVSDNLLTVNGLVELGFGGVRSGKNFTSLIGTLYNYLSAEYAGLVLGTELKDSVHLGDDAVTTYGSDVSESELSDAVSDLNLTMNVEKQFVSNRAAHYLQNVYYLEEGGTVSKGIRPTYRILNGMFSYERRRTDSWGPAMVASRTIMQLENGRNHRRFERLVSFARSRHEMLRTTDPAQIFREAGGASEIARVLNPAFRYTTRANQDLTQMKTVDVLRNLSR